MTEDFTHRLEVEEGIAAAVMPCALCALPMPHRSVRPFHLAKRMYRATVVGSRVWLPARHAQSDIGQALCPDPPASTAAFWRDDVRRENYKAARREEALRARNGRIS